MNRVVPIIYFSPTGIHNFILIKKRPYFFLPLFNSHCISPHPIFDNFYTLNWNFFDIVIKIDFSPEGHSLVAYQTYVDVLERSVREMGCL